jgi:hypothetical protein
MNEQIPQRSRNEIEAHLVAKTWKDNSFKQQLLANPKATIEQEFGVQLPEALNIRIMQENAETLYITLPTRPSVNEDELSEKELETVAGGITPVTIGVTAAGAAFTFGAAANEGKESGW